MRAPIHSDKHYVQRSLSTVLAGVTSAFKIAQAVEATTANAVDEVVEGALIKAVFVEMWVRTGDTAPGACLISLIKSPLNAVPTFAEMVSLGTYPNKKNVLYHTQGLINDQDADAIPFVRQWFKIPKGKQRFGLGDTLFLMITAQALDSIVCGFATYKEYT